MYGSYGPTIRAGVTRLDYSPSNAGWLLFAFAAGDTETFDTARSAVSGLPPYARKWLPQARAWRVRASALFSLSGRWPALAEALAEIGLTGEYQQHYQQHSQQRPSAAYLPSTVSDAFDVLCLTPQAPLELISAARKAWARVHHPDHGGNLERMKAVNVAADLCEEYARKTSKVAA